MIYHILVKPGSSRDEVMDNNSELIVRTRKKAHDGEANKAIVELLAKHFGKPKTCIVIKSGANSRHKTIKVL